MAPSRHSWPLWAEQKLSQCWAQMLQAKVEPRYSKLCLTSSSQLTSRLMGPQLLMEKSSPHAQNLPFQIAAPIIEPKSHFEEQRHPTVTP